MRALRGLIALMWIAAAPLAGFAADGNTSALAVMQAQQEAWNRGDLDAFMEGYEESADITFVGKTVSRGYEGLVRRYRAAYGTPDKMGRLTFSDLEYHPLNPESGFLIGRFHLQRNTSGGGDASGRFTVIFRQTGNGWKIVHDHTSAD